MTKKLLVLLSSLSLLCFSALYIWFTHINYTQSKSRFTLDEMVALQSQFVSKLENTSLPIDRTALAKIVKSQHEVSIANEKYINSQLNTHSSLAELLLILLLAHLAILFFCTGIKRKPKVAG